MRLCAVTAPPVPLDRMRTRHAAPHSRPGHRNRSHQPRRRGGRPLPRPRARRPGLRGPLGLALAAEVAVLAVERVDRTTLIQLRVTRRSGVPVILVASDIDGFDVLAAIEAGTTAMVLRSEATTERLLEVVRIAVSAPDRSAQESYVDLRRPGVPAQRPASRLARAFARSSAVR